MSDQKIKNYIIYFIELFGSFAFFSTLQVYFTGTFDPFSMLMFSLAVAVLIHLGFIYTRALYRRSKKKQEMIEKGTWKK